ncbi:cytochrome c oxidase subunit 4 [Pengzhenrongella sicca]|uniref:Cytochrome c oxidase polypeptide 4 n=1 Tax=Pengzhenrongella sicca TaxID=2819238 RepID=A0A8A4Z930_9MICO|nr:cytochrome c oxidase subunit 4 [Pengzhenrongella sicca]QTE28382.1 cytochrome c oxidase subunit 4 [Pengzhenrongella sicca]
MKVETRLFAWLAPFFALCGVVYGVLTDWQEPVGSAGLLLVAALVAMIGGYFTLLAKRIDARPEDDPHAEIEQGAGDQGVYSPWSWWPLVVGAAAAISFLALAVGWWLLYLGAALAVIGLVGWILEFSRGQHAH